MTAKGSGEDEFLETGAESATEVVEIRSGGCAGIDEISWSKKLGARLLSDELQSKVEHLRQQLLGNDSDVKKVRNALKHYDISVNEQLIALVKRYNFDSPGISFTPDNYDSWTRVANQKGTINDMRYLVHEIEEVEELKRIQQQTGFDFIGTRRDEMTRRQKQRWEADFDTYYRQAHSKALEAEYDFIAQQVFVNSSISIQRNVAAAIDPNRDEARLYMLVNEFPLEEHPNFSNWQMRGNETVKLTRKQRMHLRIKVNPTLAELIRSVKQIKLNYS